MNETNSATPKPRAGEPMKAGALHELIADYRHLAWPEDDGTVEAMRLNLIERALREHSSKTKVLEAERDLLRERERELVEVLKWIDEIASKEYEQDSKLRANGARTLKRLSDHARSTLAKHGR